MGWSGVTGCAFLCLRLMSEPLHEANNICKAKISLNCAMRSRKNTHDFTVFGGSFNPVSPERLRSRVFPVSGIPLALSPND